MMDNMIDFPCSNTWLKHYSRLGLTHYVEEERRKPYDDKKIDALIEEIRNLRMDLKRLLSKEPKKESKDDLGIKENLIDML